MTSRVLMRKVVRDLRARRVALLALVLIMAVGIAGLVGFASTHRDLADAKDRYFRDNRMGDFWVDVKRAPAWVTNELRALPDVADIQGRVKLNVVIDLPGVDDLVSGEAISLPPRRRPIMNDVVLERGAWFSGPGAEEVLVTDAFARANNLVPGHRLKVTLLDEQRDMLLVGTVMSPEYIYLIPPTGALAPDPARYTAIYFEESFLQEAGDLDGAYNQFLGTLVDRTDEAARDRVLAQLKARLDVYGAIEARPMKDQFSTSFIENELETLRRTSFITPVVFLVVASMVLNVMLERLVAQQRLVIGTLKAIGFSRARIVGHYMTYGLVVGLVAAGVGIVLAEGVHFGMLSLYQTIFEFPGIEMRPHPYLYLIGLGVSTGVACLGTLQGVRHAVGLQPAEAMRPAPPERAHRTPFEAVPALWRWFSFRWKMIWRSIFRNPVRSLVGLSTAVLAAMLVFGALCMRDAMIKLSRHELTQVSHQDMSVLLRDPRGLGYDAEERLRVGVTEAQLYIPADLVNGARRRTTGITGLPPGNRLYTPLGADDKPISIPPAGMVLSKKLAQVLDVEPGDSILLQPLIGERRRVEAPVVAVVDSYVGLLAYADIRYLSRLLGEDYVANTILTLPIEGANRREFLAHLKDTRDVTGVMKRQEAVDQFDAAFNKANLVIISLFVAFAMLIGFGGVLNSALVSLSERVREVATLRTLGFSSGQVAAIFAGESVVLYGIGSFVGLYAGVWYVRFLSVAYSSELFRFPIVMRPQRFVETLVLMALSIAAAQVVVWVMVKKLDWLEALKVRE